MVNQGSFSEIHSCIKRLFKNPASSDKRVALVAYIGSDAESYLPTPTNLRIICSPQAGGTDPDALRRLKKRGATVEFSAGLHMKVYWSKLRGCLITSANASSSALGAGGLKETGVLLPPRRVNIRKLIKYARPRLISSKELRLIDRKTREVKKNMGKQDKNRERGISFLEWFSLPHRTQWKIEWTDDEVSGSSKAAKGQTLSIYGCKEPHKWTAVGKNRAKTSDWLLTFTFTNRGIKSVEWQYVDFLVKIGRKEKQYYNKDWPFHAVQVHPLSKYPLPPFRITPQFRKALYRGIKEYSAEKIIHAKSAIPPAKLLNHVIKSLGRP
jgi:hypothetical protein